MIKAEVLDELRTVVNISRMAAGASDKPEVSDGVLKARVHALVQGQEKLARAMILLLRGKHVLPDERLQDIRRVLFTLQGFWTAQEHVRMQPGIKDGIQECLKNLVHIMGGPHGDFEKAAAEEEDSHAG